MPQHIYLFYTEENSVEAQQISDDLKALRIPCKKKATAYSKTQQLLEAQEGVALLLVSDNLLKDLNQVRHLEALLKELPLERLVPVITHGRRPKKGDPERQEVYATRIKTLHDVMYYRDYWYEAWITLRKAAKVAEGDELARINEDKEIAKGLSVGDISNHIRAINQAEPIEWESLAANDYEVLLKRTGVRPDDSYTEEEEEGVPIPTIDLPVEQEEKSITVEESLTNNEQEPTTEEKEKISNPTESVVPLAEQQVEETSTNVELTQETPLVEEVNKGEESIKEEAIEEQAVLQEEKEERIAVSEIIPEQEQEEFSLEGQLEHLEDLDAKEILARYDLDEVDDIDVLFHIAESQTEEDEEGAARHTYERILTLDPCNGRALIWLARLLAKNEQLEQQMEAANFYKKAIMVNDDNPSLYYEYGLLQKRVNAYHKASESFREALLLDEYYEDAYFGLAQCLQEMGRREEAKANYLQACILDEERFETAENDNYFKVLREHQPEEEIEEPSTELDSAAVLEVEENPNANTVVLVTGATSGIGRSVAGQFALSGYKVIIAGRRTERLEALKELLESHLAEAQIHCLTLDVRNLDVVKTGIQTLPEGWKEIDILVNNAGLAKGFGPIYEGDIDHWETMIDTNVKGLLYVSRAVTPIMVARKKGHIINIGSVAGVEAYAGGAVYCATKAAVDSLTRSMRLDLYQHNIKVTAVHPGHVEQTEFAKVRYEDVEKANIYSDFKPLSAKDIADTVVYIATRPEHVNIQNVLMFSTQQASATQVNRNGREE